MRDIQLQEFHYTKVLTSFPDMFIEMQYEPTYICLYVNALLVLPRVFSAFKIRIRLSKYELYKVNMYMVRLTYVVESVEKRNI